MHNYKLFYLTFIFRLGQNVGGGGDSMRREDKWRGEGKAWCDKAEVNSLSGYYTTQDKSLILRILCFLD